MKKMKISLIIIGAIALTFSVSGFTKNSKLCTKSEVKTLKVKKSNQTINMVVSHGHCSTPFSGKVEGLELELKKREDKGNPLEDMKISFGVNPNTFNVCGSDDLTTRIKTPGLFIDKDNQKMTFRTTAVYTIGIDWYQVNGKLSIKGEERDVMLFATGIREVNETNPTSIVLEGQLNLMDWGIDYDKIINGKSDSVPTKWLYVNMRFNY